MTQISNLVANDPSSAWDRISRRQCWNGAKKLGLKVNPGAKHSEMVGLFISQGIKPEQVVDFAPVVQKTPNGDKVEMYPVTKERIYDEGKELRRMEEFERRIESGIEADKKEKEAQTSDLTSLKAEFNELKGLMQQVLEAMPKPKSEVTDLNKIHWKKFQKMAKDAGMEWTTKDDRTPIIAKLEAKDESVSGS